MGVYCILSLDGMGRLLDERCLCRGGFSVVGVSVVGIGVVGVGVVNLGVEVVAVGLRSDDVSVASVHFTSDCTVPGFRVPLRTTRRVVLQHVKRLPIFHVVLTREMISRMFLHHNYA